MSSLESRLKELAAEKVTNQTAQDDLTSKLRDAQATLERERKEMADIAETAHKADSPQQQEAVAAA